VVELVFNEAELLDLFRRAGLEITQVFAIETYELDGLPEPVAMRTYVCRKRSQAQEVVDG